MAHITKIKATSENPPKEEDSGEVKKTETNNVISKKTDQKTAAQVAKEAKAAKAPKKSKAAKPDKKTFVLFRPFISLATYLKGSWEEIRQVRWPNRKATWKMFLAVIVYSALFIVLILLLDLFFEWIFNLILGK